jgi:hypothetical protein
MLGIIILQTIISVMFMTALLFAAYKLGVFVERGRAAKFINAIKLEPQEVARRMRENLHDRGDDFDEFRAAIRKQIEEIEKDFTKEKEDAEAVG